MVPAYSIAKPFTAAAILALGIDLRATAGEFVDLPERYRGLVVDDLLRHISGLPDYFESAEYRDAVSRRLPAWPTSEMLERALDLPMHPEGVFRYSNIGYTLLRLILEKATGLPFLDAVTTTVLQPLGITALGFEQIADWDQCAEAPEAVRSYDPHWVYPRTFLVTTEALAKGLSGLVRGELFDPALLLESVPVHAPGHTFTEPRYGRGVMIDGASGLIGHGGGGPGFTLFALTTPDGRAHATYAVGDGRGDATLIATCIEQIQPKK